MKELDDKLVLEIFNFNEQAKKYFSNKNGENIADVYDAIKDLDYTVKELKEKILKKEFEDGCEE